MLHVYNFFSVFSLFYNLPSHVSRGQPKWLFFANNAAKAVCTLHNSETKGLWMKLTSKVSGCYKVIHQTAITSIMLQYYSIDSKVVAGEFCKLFVVTPQDLLKISATCFYLLSWYRDFLMISTCFCLFLCNLFFLKDSALLFKSVKPKFSKLLEFLGPYWPSKNNCRYF